MTKGIKLMSQCLNPDCLQKNPNGNRFCQKCGAKLLLQERYQAIKLIGQGGFGKTFLAIDNGKPSKPSCVIKQFFPSAQGTDTLQKAAELFEKEAIRLDELGKHHQIPELLAYLTHEDNRQYLVQEYIAGENLEQELKENGVFNQEQIRSLLMDILPVLEFIHNQGVIHRDIKPENIIRRKSDQKAVLVDFGAAKLISPLNRSVTGRVIVSAECYVAPEQMRGIVYPSSDLYSLAVTAIRLITGYLPDDNGFDPLFDPIEMKWIWRQYLVDNPVSDELGNILDKMIEFGTKKRYSSATEVLQALGVNSSSSPATSTPIQIPSPPVISTPKQTTIQTPPTPQVYATPRQQSSAQSSYIENLPGGIKLEMIKIPSGSFLMGSPDRVGCKNERPRHRVNVPSFYMGKYPVTQEQYRVVMETKNQKQGFWQSITGKSPNPNPSKFKSDKNPVESVTWYDAIDFCIKLSQLTGKQYRLPSEAEWEYACRAGTQTRYYFGHDANQLGEYAWYHKNSNATTHPVGEKKPNPWGLYDMHGNVWEWGLDDWHENYNNAPNDGGAWFTKKNAQKGISKITDNGLLLMFCYDLDIIKINNNYSQLTRGGSWGNHEDSCRSAERYHHFPDGHGRCENIGFRVVCVGRRT